MKSIEFFGLSRSGKTTQRKILIRCLNDMGMSTFNPQKINAGLKKATSLEAFHQLAYDHLNRAFDTGLSQKADFFIFDRGFYDRIAMLEKDLALSRVSSQFADEYFDKLKCCTERVEHPLLFLVTPEESLRRWQNQISAGIDNSESLKYLQEESLDNLKREVQIYSSMADKDPKISLLDGAESIPSVAGKLESILGIKYFVDLFKHAEGN